MLSRGNTKLGPIWSWSLPVVETCPGASAACLAACYATKGFYQMPSVGKAHDKNLAIANGERFVKRMIGSLNNTLTRVFRIHCAGDFYSAAYIRNWCRIIDRQPYIIFYAYTRSWKVPRLRKALQELASRPNMRLWLSTDHSMSQPPAWAACRTCYLSTQDSDLPNYPVDLIFRDKPKTVLKHVEEALICPYENGIQYSPKITCASCGVCWDQDKMQKALPAQTAALASV